MAGPARANHQTPASGCPSCPSRNIERHRAIALALQCRGTSGRCGCPTWRGKTACAGRYRCVLAPSIACPALPCFFAEATAYCVGGATTLSHSNFMEIFLCAVQAFVGGAAQEFTASRVGISPPFISSSSLGASL